MQIHKNYSLKKHNTFGLDILTSYYAEVENTEEIKLLLNDSKFKSLRKLVIGSGSNILFKKDFDGLVINQISNSIITLSEDDHYVLIASQAGVIWHDLVLYCVDRNFGGIENLSLIPGKVGAAPIQNIGAYGQELQDTFYSLKAVNIETLEEVSLSKADCKFGYRDSIFKNELKDKLVITEVTLQLAKIPKPNIKYWAVKEEVSKIDKKELTIKDVAEVVCNIRKSKLPDPDILGNAGSFFKNPEVSIDEYEELKLEFKDLPGFKVHENKFKIPAAWLIEKCGYKGKRFGNAGVHDKQALVLVNYGNANAEEIIKLKNEIINAVQRTFKIKLQEEVNII
jgi:UDP-N-acetylmuramate dehydrogenase